MFGIVFLSLLVMTMVAVGIGLAMFADVAFTDSKLGAPLAVGAGGTRSRTAFGNVDGAGLARRVERAASRTVASLGLNSVANVTCNAACREHKIEVTTPEVLAIIQELRDRRLPAEVDAIRQNAQRNVTAGGGPFRCPLLLAGNLCACEAARPVSCRTRCVAGADSPSEARVLAESVEMGVTEVFRECLDASGLDDSRYELNSALVQVLDTPQAARRWARGEHILKS